MSAYRLILAEKANFPIAMMCRLLEVARSAFYAWWSDQRTGRISARAARRVELAGKIVAFHDASLGTYGAPRILADLREAGEVVSRKTVAKVMASNGIRGDQPRAFRRTTIPDAQLDTRRDLVRGIYDRRGPDRVWVGDITYLKTWQGWSYLATVIDGCTRQVVGWALAEHMREDLVIDALAMAVSRRQPPPGVIFHSDRGAQYTSRAVAGFAAAHQIRLSVGATGVCWDNALAESFFGHLKTELIYRHVWPTPARLRSAVVTYIEGFYNHRRRHSALGMISPDAYYNQLLQQPAAA